MNSDCSTDPALIPARSQRQAMDWSLVLISQGITSTVVTLESGWAVQLAPADLDVARHALHLYRVENRHWYRYFTPSSAGPIFHPGALLWVLVMVLVYVLTAVGPVDLVAQGRCDTAELIRGEWWRLWTAISLHADLPHLIGNLTFGLLLLGLAMARFGPGWALLAALIGGGLANAVSAGVHGLDHRGLGASGMVMAGLGLLAGGAGSPNTGRVPGRIWVFRGVFGAVLLFLLLGLDPGSDVLAHVAGLLSGLAFGLVLRRLPERWHTGFAINQATAAAALGLLIWAWIKACHPGP